MNKLAAAIDFFIRKNVTLQHQDVNSIVLLCQGKYLNYEMKNASFFILNLFSAKIYSISH